MYTGFFMYVFHLHLVIKTSFEILCCISIYFSFFNSKYCIIDKDIGIFTRKFHPASLSQKFQNVAEVNSTFSICQSLSFCLFVTSRDQDLSFCHNSSHSVNDLVLLVVILWQVQCKCTAGVVQCSGTTYFHRARELF